MTKTSNHSAILWLFVFSALLLITNRWLPWSDAHSFVSADDVTQYELIAQASPHLPSESLTYAHHAQRFPIPYTLGLAAKLAGLSIPSIFDIATASVFLFLLLFFFQTAMLLSENTPNTPLVALIAVALFLFNPYSFRYYFLARGMAVDLFFSLGAILAIYGLSAIKPMWLISGFLIAIFSRQTALLLIPGLTIWLVFDPAWKSRFARVKRTALAAAIAVIGIFVYKLTGTFAASFSSHDVNTQVAFALLEWVRTQFSILALGEHLFRIASPLLSCISILAVLLFLNPKTLFNIRLISLALISACIVAQPVMGGPALTGGNGSRLSALALAPLYLIVCLALSKVKLRESSNSPPLLLSLLPLTLIGSLHHKYSCFGPRSIAEFMTLQVIAAVGLTAWTAFFWKRSLVRSNLML